MAFSPRLPSDDSHQLLGNGSSWWAGVCWHTPFWPTWFNNQKNFLLSLQYFPFFSSALIYMIGAQKIFGKIFGDKWHDIFKNFSNSVGNYYITCDIDN
jgi:hypothetical protein